MKTYITDAVRCPKCKDMVTNHSEINGEHVPMCCGNVLLVESHWQPEACRWAIQTIAIPKADYHKWTIGQIGDQ